MRVSVQRMRLSDLGDVMRMERQCFSTPWHADTFRYEITGNPSAYYTVARLHRPQGSGNVGYAGLWLIAGEAHITTIGVDLAYRGLKIGERLLVDLIEFAIQRRALRVTLEVRESNLVAQKLYLKYGFSAVGMRRGYYSDTGENAIVMWIESLDDLAFRHALKSNILRLKEQTRALAGR